MLSRVARSRGVCSLRGHASVRRFFGGATGPRSSPSSLTPSQPYEGGNISDSPDDVEAHLGGASPTTLPREASRTSHLPVSFGDIAKANFRVKNAVVTSECRWSEKLSEAYGLDLYFKMEHEQRTVGFCFPPITRRRA